MAGSNLTSGNNNQSYQMLLNNYQTALLNTLQDRCALLTQLLQDTPVKELQCIFSSLIEHIFGFRFDVDWGLVTLDKDLQIREFDAVRRFLMPDGPVLKLVYKFIEDFSPKFEFPLSCIPLPSQLLLKEGKVPALYANKLQVVNPGIFPQAIHLNAFEFYFFHFAFYIINPSLKNKQSTVNQQDTLYAHLLEDYLCCFLPTDARAIPLFQTPHNIQHSPILTSSLSSNFVSPNAYSDHVLNRNLARPDSLTPVRQKPSLLKKGTVMMVASSGSASPCGISSQAECWKSETFLLILKEMYLNQISLDHQQHILDLTMKTFVPSHYHVWMVRILVKHLHFFFNSSLCSNNISGHGQIMIDSLGRLKSLGMTQLIQKEMYDFLKSTFDHWPLDASFRVPLETWLSYIQPWRYVQLDVELIVWQKFMTENVLFYTSLLEQVLKRFVRMDFNCPKNAYMLFRVTKVFSQSERYEGENRYSPYMRDMIMQAERGCVSKPSSLGMSSSYIQRSPEKSFSFHKVAHLESPGTSYIPLFSEPVFLMVSQLLSNVAAALEKAQYSCINQNSQNKSFFSKIYGMFDISDEVYNSEDNSPADIQKVSTYLEKSITQLCTLFPEVKRPVLNPVHADTSDLSFLTNNNNAAANDSKMKELNQVDQYQLINKKKKSDIIYQGNPDLQPVRTYEFAGLVSFLSNFSQQLNEKHASDIDRLYHQPTIRGRICRRVLAKPITFYEVVKSSNMQCVTRNPVHLPPRINLRFLANKQLIVYFFVFLLVAYWFGYNPVLTIFLLFLVLSLSIFVAAFLYPIPIQQKQD